MVEEYPFGVLRVHVALCVTWCWVIGMLDTDKVVYVYLGIGNVVLFQGLEEVM